MTLLFAQHRLGGSSRSRHNHEDCAMLAPARDGCASHESEPRIAAQCACTARPLVCTSTCAQAAGV
jgi:hypothetical protein